MLFTALLVIAFLVSVSSLYVAAELGMVAARRTRVRQLADEGNWLAAKLWPVVDKPVELDRAIAACQIGITLSSLLLGAYSQATLAPVLAPWLDQFGGLGEAAAHSAAAIIVLVAMTVFHMIAGELLPKSIALEFPTQTSLATIIPVQWSLRIFAPLLWLFNGSGLLLLKLLRIAPTRHRHIHSAGEIDILLTETAPDDELDAEDRRRLRRALRLGARRARDLMVPRAQIASLDARAPLEECLKRMSEAPYTRLPVHRGSLDEVIGVVHTKDVLLQQLSGEPMKALTKMVRPLVTVPGTATADHVLVMLRERRVQLALVLDERGQTAGLITLEDVLAEVFGALGDELKAAGAGRRRKGA